jgi:multiple sugar transport system substrate-binding protein/putative aldouronate transport system substrate-binding protein
MMMKKICLALAVVIGAASLAYAGGGQSGGSSSAAGGRNLYRVNVYTQLANYAGMQTGWFGKIVKDKFNLELNIIPTAEGVYATRMAAGNLGDLIVFGANGDEFQTAIEAGMLLDWNQGDILDTYGKDIKANFGRALQHNAEVFGRGVSAYGFGHNVSTTPTASEASFYHPDIRFDLYRAIGSPEIPDLTGYLDVLKRMVDYQPSGDSGLPAYAISLFPDWDGDTVMSVKCMGAFYGYDEFGFTEYNAVANTARSVLDANSLYMQGLKFFNKAYQMGILDPDSATQTFSDVANKYADGRVYWSIFSWLGPANYNTQARLAQGKGMFAVAAKDQKNIVYGTNIYGGDRIWAIGSKARYPERIMELINWLSTSDGVMTSNWGPQGVTWDYDRNNKAYLTDLGVEIHHGNPNVEMPVSAGGGLWVDGQNKINNTTFTLDDINPVSGERYNREFWSSELSRAPDPATKIWQDAMGALSADEYLEKNGHQIVVTASDFVRDVRSPDLEQKWAQVSTAIKDSSWRAIYARNDVEFDRIVAEMINQARGFGYDECIAWDMQQAQKRAVAVRRALGR